MTLRFVGEQLGMKIYTSDVIEDKIFVYSKHCVACGAEVDIFDNKEICWMSSDRTHHPSFQMQDAEVKDEI